MDLEFVIKVLLSMKPEMTDVPVMCYYKGVYYQNQGLVHAEELITDKIIDYIIINVAPCPLCFHKLWQKDIKYIFFGLDNHYYKYGFVNYVNNLNLPRQKPKVFGNFMKQKNVLSNFFKKKRHNTIGNGGCLLF